MPLTSGKRAFLDVLKQEGVEYLFGNPGTTELPLMDGLVEEPALTYVLALQEAAVVAMADGYAQASGKLGVISVHVAPGLGNALGMLYDAQKAGAPLLVTAGQHDQSFNVTEPILWADLPPIARPFVKWSAEVRRLEDLPRLVHRAAKTALAPPTGPVFLSLPADVLQAEGVVELGAPTRVASRIRGDRAAVEAAAETLARAERPLILAGDAVAYSDAHAELVAVAEALGAAVYAEGVANTASFPSSHPLFRGPFLRLAPAVRQVLSEADVLFSVGGDLLTLSLPSDIDPMPPGLEVIHLDTDPWELGKNYPTGVAILGDPKATLPDLLAALEARMTPARRRQARERLEATRAAKTRHVEELRARARAEAQRVPMTSLAAISAVADALPPEAVVVDESISSSGGLRTLVRSDDPRSFFGLRGGGIGWGLPAAIGVKLALPGPAGRGPDRRRERHVHLPGALDRGALPPRRHLRDPEQRLLPHPQAADPCDEGLRGPGRPVHRHGPRGPARRLRAPGRVARRAGRADREGGRRGTGARPGPCHARSDAPRGAARPELQARVRRRGRLDA